MSIAPQFRPETSALILIDYQVGTTQLIKNQMPDSALRNAVNLAKAGTAFKMSIVLTARQEDHLQKPTRLQRVITKAYTARIKHIGEVNVWDGPK